MRSAILVTGCSGFLGGRVAKYFGSHPQKYSVVAASRQSRKKDELVANNCDFRPGNLLDKEYCHNVTTGIDYVVHCAAMSSPWGNYDAFYQANVEVTRNILAASANNRVKKFVFISTPSIYFNFQDRFLVKETDPLPTRLVNNYAATKLIAERYVLDRNGKDINTLALRPRAIIGAEDTVIFPRLLRAHHAGKLKIIGKGDNVCDLTCAANVIAAIACTFDAKDAAFGRAFNITDGNPVILWQVINALLNTLQLAPVTTRVPEKLAFMYAGLVEMKHKLFSVDSEPELTRYGLGILSKSLTIDITQATKHLGYVPVQTTMDGIAEFVKWYQTKN
ncbi:MAG: NAD-dependent epimerase/dehydratase family protein [Cyclobacteriaceae bacterium]|nr:NAD-dependent epimerase/dehydratase family protein [Cyclobacteriaceae bacterium]MDH5249587.1 NAD-dependent epimerase/dehydratase family protein [Cyclobacteriaceae bacterium]